MITTNANADLGRSSGAQISLITKSGTSEFHGSLYEYHRNTVTSANNWFNNKAGVEREQLLRNNFASYLRLDPGLYKAFKIKENLQLKFRWEIFNVTNTQSFKTLANFSLPQDPFKEQAPSDFGRFTEIQDIPRAMQFALRIEF